MDLTQRRIEIATALFAGWSSGNPDAPEPYFHPEGVLMDVCSGTFEGWPAIRAYFASALARSQDLRLVPDGFWSRDDGLAVHYVMSGTVANPATFGAEHVGRTWRRPRARLPRSGCPRPLARHRTLSGPPIRHDAGFLASTTVRRR